MNLTKHSYLINFLKREGIDQFKSLIFLSLSVALVSTLMVAMINKGASLVADEKPITIYFFAYLILLGVFWFVARQSNKKNVTHSQFLIHKFVMRTMKMVLQSDLINFERIGATRILNSVGKDAQTLSGTIPLLIGSVTSVSIVIFLIIYTAFISLTAFIILTIVTLLIAFITSRALMKSHNRIMEAWKAEIGFFAIYNDFLFGFQEIKLNKDRAKSIAEDFIALSKKTAKNKADALVEITNFFSFLQTMLYILIGIMIFVVPILSTHFSKDIIEVATTTLFLVGSLSATIQTIPSLSQGNVAAMQVLDIEEILKRGINNEVKQYQFDEKVTSIELKDAVFRYDNKENFKLGPINFKLSKGKIYFVRGSNGSGKTTLLRLLVGLYNLEEGGVYVNGQLLKDNLKTSYQNLFAVVFNDSHLFSKLYGISDKSLDQMPDLISLMELNHKIEIDNKSFNTLDLSTGQRKRIALMVALMEDRDFIVLDEWAADQDPVFRKKFYKKILPSLKKQGKTVIALTHDDAYYDTADEIIKLDNGKMNS